VSEISVNIHKKSASQLLAAFLLLLVGGLLYVTFRSDKLLMFRVIDAIGLGDATASYRSSVNLMLPSWIVYCLPDALWSASYILLTDLVMRNHSVMTKLATASIIPLVGVVSELLQMAGLMPGTFDFGDIVAYAAPYIIYVLTIKFFER